MTKTEWSDLMPKQKVKALVPYWNKERTGLVDTWFFGTVVKLNSNGSQALVRWGSGAERWYGRTGIELDK